MNELNVTLHNTAEVLYHTQRNSNGPWLNPPLQLTSGMRRDRLISSLAGGFNPMLDITSTRSSDGVIHTIYITDTNKLYYMTLSVATNRILTAPIDLTTYFPELADWRTDNVTLKRVSSTMLGNELHVVALMSNDSLGHYIRKSTGWSRGGIRPEALYNNQNIKDIDCFTYDLNTRTYFSVVFTHGTLLTRANFLVSGGGISSPSDIPSFTGINPLNEATVAETHNIGVALYSNQAHYILSAKKQNSIEPQLLHVVENMNTYAFTETNLSGTYSIPFGIGDVSCAFVGQDLHVVALSNEQTTNNNVKHTVRASNGSWQSFLGNVNSVVSNIGYGKNVSVC